MACGSGKGRGWGLREWGRGARGQERGGWGQEGKRGGERGDRAREGGRQGGGERGGGVGIALQECTNGRACSLCSELWLHVGNNSNWALKNGEKAKKARAKQDVAKAEASS